MVDVRAVVCRICVASNVVCRQTLGVEYVSRRVLNCELNIKMSLRIFEMRGVIREPSSNRDKEKSQSTCTHNNMYIFHANYVFEALSIA